MDFGGPVPGGPLFHVPPPLPQAAQTQQQPSFAAAAASSVSDADSGRGGAINAAVPGGGIQRLPPPLPPSSKLLGYMNQYPSAGGAAIPSSSSPSNTNMSSLAATMATMSMDNNAPAAPIVVSSSLKKINAASITEFVPSGSRHSSTGSGSLLPAAGSSINGLSPRHSPTPSMLEQQDVTSFNDGGTTYFYTGDEMNPQQQAASGQQNGSGGGVANGGAPSTNGSNGNGNNGNGVNNIGHVLPDYAAYGGASGALAVTPSAAAAVKARATTPGFMAENELRLEILKRQIISHTQVDPETSHLPAEVDNFSTLCPLEASSADGSSTAKSNTFGYVTSVYKANNMKTGSLVCLRRVHSYRLVNTKCMSLVEQWKKLSHSNIVSLRQVFTTKSFSDHSIVFVYDFYPNAETMMQKHFSQSNQAQMPSAFSDPFSGTDGAARPYSQHKNQLLRQQALLSQNGFLPESLIWTYVIQLTSALRHIHSAGLACRALDPSKILVLHKSRLLINCCGIYDVLTFDPANVNPASAMAHYQQEDLISLGKIVLALACNSFAVIQRENLQAGMEIVTQTYSSDLRNLIMYLLTNPARIKSVNDLMPMIGARFYTQLESAYVRNDTIEQELSKEVESTRLFRLVTKLSTVVDRAELQGDYGWAEYGDRYMLKLFRDYVFHQVMDDQRPWLDMAHVITSLNRLDAGSPERICLMSRDEQNVLVVSFAELKSCLDQSFAECVHAQRNGVPAAAAGVHHMGGYMGQ